MTKYIDTTKPIRKYDDEPPEEEPQEIHKEEPEEPIVYERELDRFTDWLYKE